MPTFSRSTNSAPIAANSLSVCSRRMTAIHEFEEYKLLLLSLIDIARLFWKYAGDHMDNILQNCYQAGYF